MEKTKEEIAGTRQTNLKTAFELGIHTLLTSCSKEGFCKAFPNFAPAEVERLHRLFIQVITSLHEDIEDEFESLCVETQHTQINVIEEKRHYVHISAVVRLIYFIRKNALVNTISFDVKLNWKAYAGSTLNMVEQLVEEQNLDPLFPEKSNVEEVRHYLSEAKQNEINYLTTMLETAEEQKRSITSRLEILKKERHDFSDAAATDIVNKIRTGNQKYNTNNNIGFNS
ncbi:hypothetical protein MTR67_050264 [Solanum verrucosum]|nr:hypothetical protein MTR67_050264 [Solanum verrucosum]